MKQEYLNLKEDTLTESKINRLKWAAVIAVIGIPLAVQLFGAMLYYGPANPLFVSPAAIAGIIVLGVIAGFCGPYVLSNRISLYFSGLNKDLSEWGRERQLEAFSFAYRFIAKGCLLAFALMSIIGAVQLLNLLGWIDVNFGQSFSLNMSGMAALLFILTYVILLLPTLYTAWTLKPLPSDD